ncbi:MAG: PucR family transcriptional regulator [Nocardioidaceae bacterium]
MVSVADVLARADLALVPVRLPRPDAEVRWVATSELADPSPFLEGGEVLLTTGLGTAGWRRQWHGYVCRLAEVGVAALGIGTGLTHPKPPAALVRACDDLGVNLFEVPRATTFVAISRVTARLLEEREQAAAREALTTQRSLTEAALRQDEPSALLARLATVLDGATCTVTRDGQLDAGPFGPLAAALDVEAVRHEVGRLRPQGLRAASSLAVGTGTTVVQPLGLRGRPESYLAVLVPGRLDDHRRSALTTTVALASLAVESRIDRRATERRVRGRAMELLVAGDAPSAEVVLNALGEVALPPRAQLLRARRGDDQPTGLLDDTLLDDALGDLEQQAPLAARMADELWAVVPPGRLAAVVGALAGLSVGVGTVVPLEELARSHETAGLALRECTAAAPVVRWDEVVGEGVLALLDADRARVFGESFLGPLLDDPDLVATLQAFLRQHGSRGRVADELGVHRNTVRNRLTQIEATIGRSLDDPQTRVNAWVALQAVRPSRC